MRGPEQQPPTETRTNLRVSVEKLIPSIKPVDPNYKFDPNSCYPAKASASESVIGRMTRSSEVSKFFSEWRGQVVIDIGAYNTDDYKVACAAGAQSYVAVEPFNFSLLEETFRMPKGRMVDRTANIPFALVNTDAVGFLRRLPPWSVSVMMFAIDPAIMRNQEYRDWVKKQIQRVLHKEGAFISNGTVGFQLGADFDKENFEKEEPNIADYLLTKYTRKI